jgi:hypothetical protein
MALVIINEQHTLSADQTRCLDEKFGEGEWQRYNVPAAGWTAEEIEQEVEKLHDTLVFCSPIPLMIKLAVLKGEYMPMIFHNDRREKKELPNGKVISVVAQDGWVIL